MLEGLIHAYIQRRMRYLPYGGRLFFSSASPIIVVGMHRSGTSLVAQMLEHLGVYVGGNDVDEHHEWRRFSSANRAMLGEGARVLYDYGWTAPKTLEFMRKRAGYAHDVARWAEGREAPWGWKDPRSSLTLPIWLYIYPNARVLHVLRNGHDVARSLQARDSLTLAFSLALRSLYIQSIGEHIRALPDARIHRINYEELGTIGEVRRLAAFAGVDASAVLLGETQELVRRAT